MADLKPAKSAGDGAAAEAEDDALLLPRALFGLCSSFCLGLMGVRVLERLLLLFFFVVPNEVPRLKI